MQHAFHHVDAEHQSNRDSAEDWPSQRYVERVLRLNGWQQYHAEEYFGKLAVGEAKRPQSEVAGRVRHCTEDELDGLNQLVDNYLIEVEMLRANAKIMCRRLELEE